MAAAPAHALAADKRSGFAAATNLPTQRGALPWASRPMTPAPNAWGSSSLLSLKEGEGSGSFVNINDCPSSPGSSSTSTDESDLLDSPVACGRTSHDSVTAISHPQSTELGSGSWKFAHSQISFLDGLKAPLSTIPEKRPTSYRKGFTICADDFPVLGSKNSQSNGQQGHCFQGRPSFSSVVIAARDEQRKTPLTGGDPVSTANFSWEPEQAQLHVTQIPDICMPPPCIDYWHPPDRNGIRLGGVVSYCPCKPADKTDSFPVESFTHGGHSILNQGAEESLGLHGVYLPGNNDSCNAHVPVDTFAKSLPHLILEKVKDNHSDALEKQPVIKKDVVLLEKIRCLPHHIPGKVKGSDALEKQPVIKKNVALLEKIKCLNIKARNLRACNMPEISLCEESKVECPKTLNLKADHVANDVLFSAATSYITSGFDMANSVSERSKPVFVGTSNMSAILVTIDLSEGHVTEFSESKKMGNSADNHVFGVADTSANLCGSSAMDTASNIWGHGWKEQSTVYDLPVTTTNNLEDQPFPGNCLQQVHVRTANDMLKSPYPYEIQNHVSNDVPQETNKNLCKQNARNAAKNTAAAISSTQNVMFGAMNSDISMLEHIAQKTEAESHDSSAPKHLQTEDGQVPKQGSISRGSTPSSDTADSNICPSIPNTTSPVKNNEIKIMEPSDPKGMLHRNESRTLMHSQMEEKRRQVHSHGRILMGCTPASGPAGVNKGSFIHNVIPSAKNNENSMMEHIAWKSASQSHENSSPKHLQMENRKRQAHPQERVLRDRSNIAENTKDIITVSGTRVNAPNAEAKPHADLSTQSKNRLVSPCVFGTENTETSGLRKAPVSGVVINSSIITMQAPLARAFTVGSIMLGDVSLASVNHDKTVTKEVGDDTTNSCASPKQTKQLGKNQNDEQHAKDPHGGDSIMCTEVKEPSKKEGPVAGGVNYMAIPAPNQPSGNQSTVLRDAVPAKTSEIEKHSHQPEYKALHLQNPRQMLQAEKHITSSDNSSTSILKTKTHDKQTLHTSTATQSGIKTEPQNREDEKISKHQGRSSAASDQGTTDGSATLAPDLSEQEANSLVLKIMQELSDQLEQVEKQLDSTHVVAVRRSEPTQTVLLPGYTWGEHCVSHSQRQYHVDGQGNVWTSYAANVCGFTQGASGLPTAHVLPGSISVPENNTLNGSSTPVWMWDAAEGILTSDIGNVPVVGTAITSRSSSELTENIYGVSQVDPHCMQVIGGMSYEAVANPEIQYHTGLAHQQVNPVWFPHGQQDVSCHSSSGTGVYWPQMD